MDERKILSLQALRAIAAILVVFSHCERFTSAFLTVHSEKYLGQCFGNFGVDIFFVISGFIMVYINQHHFGRRDAIVPFLYRRIVRIFPIYWLVTLIVLGFIIPSGLYAYALPESQYSTITSIKHIHFITNSFLLIPYYDMAGEQLSPIVGPAWTLIYEMFFYYVFAFLLLFSRKIYFKILCGIFLGIVLTQFVIQWMQSHFHMQQAVFHYCSTFGNNIILEFVFGCFIAERYLAKKILSNGIALFIIFVSALAFIMSYHIPQAHFYELHGLSLLSLPYHIKAIGTGIPAACLVYGLLSLEANQFITIPNVLVRLGNASYSIYLIHFSISIVILLSIVKELENYLPIPGDLAMLILWVVSIVLGYLFYNYVEKSLYQWIKNIFSEKKSLLTQSE